LISSVVGGRGFCLVNLSLGVAAGVAKRAAALGHVITPPQRCIGLIDTGCNALEIDQSVVQRLGLRHTDERPTATASGRVVKRVYPVQLEMLNSQGEAVYVAADAEAREMPVISPDFQVLIGWSVLRHGTFTLNGRTQTYLLNF